MAFLKGAALGFAIGILIALLGTMLILVFGITRVGTTAVPGTIEVVSTSSGFSMQTGGGVLIPVLLGAVLGGMLGHRRDAARTAA